MPELHPQQTVADGDTTGESHVAEDDARISEMLVAEFSIEGMCGVY